MLCGFAQGAPGHHQLVVKAHPLEQNGAALSAMLKNLVEKHQIKDRLRYIEGGKLAKILTTGPQRCHRQFNRRTTGIVARHPAETVW